MPAGSTKKLYLHGLAASLVNSVVASGYSLLVIRLSLTYLEKEEFGLLCLLSQVSGYISILDLGLFTAFSRILIDYTTGTQDRYANALSTAVRVFNVLGFAGFLIACLVAFFGSAALSIPAHLQTKFLLLMLAQGVSLWVAFAVKPLSAPLVANGKHYLIYWLSSALFILNALLFWLALRGGIGIYSSILASSVQLLLYMGCSWLFARPYRAVGAGRGAFDSAIFKEVLAFARDSMFWQIGGQTLAALPIFLASAWFALNATADLSAGMKLILLMVAVCTRFGDMSVTPLSIEFAKGNQVGAATQMIRIAGVSGGIGACAALFVVCVNPAFVSWWMLGKVSWAWHANVAGALWIAILSVNQCMYGYAVVSRQMQLLRWALLAECLVYVALAFATRTWAGSACLLWAKPVATLVIGIYIAWQLKKHSHFDATCLLPSLLRQSLALALLVPSCIFCSQWIATACNHALLACAVSGLLSSVVIVVALPLLFTRSMRADLRRILAGLLVKLQRSKLDRTY